LLENVIGFVEDMIVVVVVGEIRTAVAAM